MLHKHAQTVLDNITLYASPYLVATKNGYTKHYYAGSQRICTQVGTGGFDRRLQLFHRDTLLEQNVQSLFGNGDEQISPLFSMTFDAFMAIGK